MSKDTARFLLGLVNDLTISVGADDFDQAVAQVLTARAELQAIVGEPPPELES